MVNMTEDDTFNALKRTPYAEMFQLVNIWISTIGDKRTVEDLLRDYGWTYNDYSDARSKSRDSYRINRG